MNALTVERAAVLAFRQRLRWQVLNIIGAEEQPDYAVAELARIVLEIQAARLPNCAANDSTNK